MTTTYLRFTPQEYQALCRACQRLDLTSSPAAIQASLANATRQAHPALAEYLGSLRKEEVGILVGHFHPQGQAVEPPPPTRSQDDCGLTMEEWKAIWRASEVVRLHDDSPQLFPNRLFREVAETVPVLAKKLAGLSEGQLAAICRRVKDGRRWCF